MEKKKRLEILKNAHIVVPRFDQETDHYTSFSLQEKDAMTKHNDLIALFRAFSERQDATFIRIAEQIIGEELAANHHVFATELQKALKVARDRIKQRHSQEMLPLPRDRRNGEQLVTYSESTVSQDQIVFSEAASKKIFRILEEHRNRFLLAQYGYQPKRKILFWGPPGCGKTFTANFIAHELGIPLATIRLNAVISSFLGDTAAHIQRVFDLAGNQPMVLLLDEIDALAKNRDDRNDVGELKRIVNSMLQAMDAFASNESIIIAASNHQYLLDPAIWRRFDDIVQFPLPTGKECQQYLKILLNGVSLDGSLKQVTRMFASLSFADIKRIIIDAIKSMILQGEERLSMIHISESLGTLHADLSAAMAKPSETTLKRRK